MAFGGNGGGRLRRDINVTPLVDIVLVMLIIFLVAIPAVMMKIDVAVPEMKAGSSPGRPTTIQVTRAGAILLDDVEVLRTDLATKLRDRLEHDPDKVVFVDFDGNTRYGDAVAIMDVARGAGAATVAMKTPPPRD